MNRKFNILLLSLFQIGKIKKAPGTFASITTCLVFLFLVNYINLLIIGFITVIIFFYSLFAINNTYTNYQSKDPQEIVIDEFVGQMIPLLAIPIYEILYPTSLINYCFISFILFRFFDILKPFPISYIDTNIEGSLGVMLDDIVAGLFTVIVILIILFFLGG